MLDTELINKVSDALKKLNLKIGTAESCSGGLLAHYFTSIPGSSQYFECGVVCYSNKSKTELLHVSESILLRHGAVSKETAEAMAVGIRMLSQTDIGISTTGIAGPTGGTKEKPVGLVYIGISTKQTTTVKKYVFSEDRLRNIEQTCVEALRFLLDVLNAW